MSLVFTVAGVGDWILTWIPLRFGSPEWEFGTIVSSFAGLPLVALGFAGLLGAAVARGIRWQIVAMAWVLLLWTLLILAALVVFALDVPLAVAAAQDAIRTGIIKATIKTAFLGMLFSAAFLFLAVSAFRRSRRGQ